MVGVAGDPDRYTTQIGVDFDVAAGVAGIVTDEPGAAAVNPSTVAVSVSPVSTPSTIAAVSVALSVWADAGAAASVDAPRVSVSRTHHETDPSSRPKNPMRRPRQRIQNSRLTCDDGVSGTYTGQPQHDQHQGQESPHSLPRTEMQRTQSTAPMTCRHGPHHRLEAHYCILRSSRIEVRRLNTDTRGSSTRVTPSSSSWLSMTNLCTSGASACPKVL